jgi:hypothetical protein
VTEPLNIISANCTNGCPIAENIHIPKTVTIAKRMNPLLAGVAEDSLY